jgi:hypothetical protein
MLLKKTTLGLSLGHFFNNLDSTLSTGLTNNCLQLFRHCPAGITEIDLMVFPTALPALFLNEIMDPLNGRGLI